MEWNMQFVRLIRMALFHAKGIDIYLFCPPLSSRVCPRNQSIFTKQQLVGAACGGANVELS